MKKRGGKEGALPCVHMQVRLQTHTPCSMPTPTPTPTPMPITHELKTSSRAFDAAAEFDAVDDVPPLIGSSKLKLDPMPPMQL